MLHTQYLTLGTPNEAVRLALIVVVTFACGIATAVVFRPRMEPFHPQISAARSEPRALKAMYMSTSQNFLSGYDTAVDNSELVQAKGVSYVVQEHFRDQQLQKAKKLVGKITALQQRITATQMAMHQVRKASYSKASGVAPSLFQPMQHRVRQWRSEVAECYHELSRLHLLHFCR